ncbi:TonB-linked outer membrane protein, SusC/RagA family [Pedobacter sp. ok626]|uniref:SusC/RagA family TonB-linked outer membrane protein n=1 Tax=Pedobacter sp. ok626 TaxID=1761882 RepID=UPI00088C5FB4|nr:SusC/RagA family TonB-linked outer membrane protein [Pedobacter sp. ok626]SDK66355.1 TonB-linked outer membrane protein, SusC/RagA family [Pedobacter sp. ok626]
MKRKLLMILGLFLTVTFAQPAWAQEQITLQKALAEIQKTYGTKFSYQAGLVNNVKVGLNLPLTKSEPVENVLKKILYPNKMLFLYVQENYYTIIRDTREDEKQLEAARQNTPEPNYRTVTGKVTDEKGNPLVGVTVFPEGTNVRQGVISSSDGSYTLRLLGTADAIVFTYVGMQPKKLALGKSNVVNATLYNEQNVLNEVQVVSTGYAKISKERATGSFDLITKEDIKEVPSVNLLEKLEGETPGLQVNLRNNTISIRGRNSFGSGYNPSPLIVIDGFPVMDNEDGRAVLSKTASGNGTSGSAILSRFNPDDIESITVLKDAAAASIWGAQAANGVIVIETKKGRNTPPMINFGTNLSISAPSDLNNIKTMNSAQYIDLERELKDLGFITDPAVKPSWAAFNTNRPQSEALEWMFKVDRGTATIAERDAALAALGQIDNRSQIKDLLLQNAVSQQYNLSLSGGANKSTYYLSTNYTKDIPVFRGNKAESFFVNSNLNSKLFNDRVNLSFGLNYNYSNSVNNPAALDAMGTGQRGLRPYELLQDANGNNISRAIRYREEVVQDFMNKGYLSWRYSPLDELDQTDYNTQSNRLRFNMGVDTKIIEGVNFVVSGMLQRNIEETNNVDRVGSYSVRDMLNYATTVNTAGKLVTGIPYGGILGLSNYNGWEYSLRSQVNVDRNVGGLLNIAFLAGAEIRQNRYQSSTQQRYGFNEDIYQDKTVNPTVPYNNVDGWQSTISYNNTLRKNINRAMSYYSNIGLSFLSGKYVASGSIRFDDFTITGASRNQRAQPLWSAGLKWNAKLEPLVKDINWLNALNFRLTYGVSGTLPTGSGNVVTLNTSVDNLTNETTAQIASPANNQISWEKVKSFNFGVDFAILNNRLAFNIDAYDKRTADILYTFPYNSTYGWNSLMFNSASMKSHGFELGMRANVIRHKDYSWSSVFNFSYNTNEVTDSRLKKNTTSNIIGSSLPTVGLPVDYIYAYRWAGLDDKGQSQVYNKNGDILNSSVGNNQLTADDLVYMGRATAPYFGGFNNDFRYKQFTMGVRISYSMGNVIRKPSVESYPDYSPYQGAIGMHSDLAQRWKQAGDENFTNVPGLKNITFNSLNRYKNADILMISGSYVRLQQISLGYIATNELLKRTPFKSASINASVRNLGLLWVKNKYGIDPQYMASSSYNNLAPAKTFFISINTSF